MGYVATAGIVSGSCRRFVGSGFATWGGFVARVWGDMPKGTPDVERQFDPIECGKEVCDVVFTPTRYNQKYCPEHRTKPNKERYRYLREAEEKGSLGRVCKRQPCQKLLRGKRANNLRVKYCSDECAALAKVEAGKERARQKAQVKAAERGGAELSPHVRQGALLRKLEEVGDAKRIDAGVLSVRQAAEIHGTTPANVSRSMDAWRLKQVRKAEVDAWEPSPLTRAMLPADKLVRIKALGPAGEGSPEHERLADELTRTYDVFSRRFFELEGVRPVHREFHLRWIRAIIVAYATGAKQLILSPPRHGKSELLIRFVVWMIVMFPNIRIVWVAANQDVAKIMLGAVKDHLMNNEPLIRATLPPGETYRPAHGSGRPWSAKEIKVAQQTHVGAKSSSMLALGATSKILSRDMDIIIVDDLEDFDSTEEPAQRKKTKKKFAEYGTRKEEKTAWVDIGSRQHPDDVAGALLRGKGRHGQGWRIIVDTAHEDCQLDPDEIAGHDENGCVLFPEVRSYRWLMEKSDEMDDLGVVGAYEMRYLNRPTPTEGIVFDMDRIREHALDRSRDIGLEELPPGQLIAGLDPASKGMQAGFLWHWVPGSLSMVDLEVQKAGGFEGAMRLMRDWYELYDQRDWYYEDNSQQTEFFRDPRVPMLKRELGLTIKPHTTGKNKQDPELGISSMAPWFHDGTINLPYGTAAARKKVNQFLSQLELWTTDGVQRGRNAQTDIKMAAWFPFPRIVRWEKRHRHQNRVERGTEQSYPGVSRTNAVPWTTAYPKGK